MSAVRSSCGGNWRPADAASGVADKFPAGLRVLVVDDDPTCLLILERMLKRCLYEVTKCNRAEIALSLLRENKNGYDVVISDVHMPDMDGFKLLEHVGLEMDLPVIMMSADDNKAVIMKGVTHDACDYLIKPVRMDTLKNIWQHVVRKKKHEWKELEQSRSGEEVENRQPKQTEDADYSSSANEGSWRNSKRHKDEEEDLDDRDDTSTLKKPRVVWSVELHKQFVAAVNQLGIDKAVPKKILELMNVPGLTRENVASHLQKYRLYLTRISRGLTQQHLGVLSNGFMGSQDSGPFGNMSSLTGLDLHAMAVSGHLPAQNRPAPQSAAFIKGDASSGMIMPGIVQRNIFSFENPKFRFGEGQQLQQMTNGKEINLLHGIPANMESKQITNMHGSKSAFGNVNMQALQPQSKVSKIPLSIDLLNVPNGAGAVQMRNANPAHNTGSQSSPVASFSNNNSEFVGKSFPLASGPEIMPAKRMLHGQTHSRITGLIAYGSDLDKFNQIIQQLKNSHGWELAGARLQFDDSHRNLDVQQQKFSVGTTFNSGGAPAAYLGETANQRMVDHNSVKIKGERISDVNFDPQNIFLPQEYDLEDLVSSHLKQRPGSNGPADEEFGFDGYPPISNILV